MKFCKVDPIILINVFPLNEPNLKSLITVEKMKCHPKFKLNSTRQNPNFGN